MHKVPKRYSNRNIRLFVDCDLLSDINILLQAQQSHYLLNVMRCRSGDSISVFNGRDGEWNANIKIEAKNTVWLNLIDKKLNQTPVQPLALVFAPVRRVMPSFIVEKATEMGVSEIYPVLTARSVVRKLSIDKMIKTSIEAAEQSESVLLPVIHPMMDLAIFFQHHSPKYDGIIFFSERSEARSIKDVLLNLPKLYKNNAILIGPEGGFTSEEKVYIESFPGVIPTTFGVHIMRSETAIIAGIAIYQSLLERWNA